MVPRPIYVEGFLVLMGSEINLESVPAADCTRDATVYATQVHGTQATLQDSSARTAGRERRNTQNQTKSEDPKPLKKWEIGTPRLKWQQGV